MDSQIPARLFAPFFAIAISVLSGCTNIDFKEPITSYNQGMATSGAVLSTYYTGLNDAARDTYIIQAKYNPKIEIKQEDEKRRKTPLVAAYPPEAIKARLDSIGLISEYGSKLAKLAGSNAPERINTGVVNLGSAYTNLASNFEAAANLGNNDSSRAYVQPVSNIVGQLSEQYLDSKRDQVLTDAIKSGHKSVNDILLLMEADLPVIAGLAKANASSQLSHALDYYNKNRLGMSFEQRASMLDEISRYSKTYQTLTVYQPTEVVVAMRKANDALLAYAENPKDENRVVRLTSEIDTFNSRVTPIAQAISQLRSK